MTSEQNELKIHRLNESYTAIEGTPEQLIQINDFLKVERPDAWFDQEVQRGQKSPFDYFASAQNGMLLVQNGHIELLSIFGVKTEPLVSDYTNQDIDEFLEKIRPELPFAPHDFQEKAFRESILNVKQVNKMCTSSGKSMTISLLAEFFRLKGKKGLILVPNINLLTQFKSDIKEYNLETLYENTHVIGGGQSIRHFNKPLTISTWQSLSDYHQDLGELDFVMCDEAHRFASEETSAIIKKTVNCKYKWGFTGTIPESPVRKMQLIGMFGLPKTYVTSRELIDRGLATPIYINSIIFEHTKEFKKEIRVAKGFPQRLKLIKEHEGRNEFVVNLTTKLNDSGNTLVLFQHTDHGKTLFYETMSKLFPDVKVENKNITGKRSFEFQEQYGVYFLIGDEDAKTREKTRLILI